MVSLHEPEVRFEAHPLSPAASRLPRADDTPPPSPPSPPSPSAAPQPPRPRRGYPLFGAPLLVGLVLLVVAFAQADRSTSGGVLGLVEVLPVAWWLGVAVLSAGFVGLVVVAPGRNLLLGAYLVAMIVALHATPGLIEPHARFPTAWTHVGFVDHIVETGTVDPGYDARYNWPGAFSFGALLVQVTGAESARDLLRFTPVVVNLLMLAPLAVVVRHVTRDARVRWCALWLVVITSWVGQDYLAPQALALLIYLTIVGLLLRWFRRPVVGASSRVDVLAAVRRRWPGLTGDTYLGGFVSPTPPAGPAQRLGLVATIALLGSVVAFSHQLTPLLLPVIVFVLVVVGRIDRPLVPAILAVCAAGWLLFGTTSFLQSNLVDLASGVGDLGAVVGDNVDSRTSPDPMRQLVLGTRLALTAAVGVLALVGMGRQRRQRRLDWALVGVAAAPVALLALNSYGGEMILRVSLFSLPFLAVLGAFGLVGENARAGRGLWLSGGALLAVSLVIMPAYVVARYGNEAFERVESTDIAAWDHVATRALPGSVVVVPDFAGPWRYRGLMDFDYRVYADLVEGMPATEGLDEVLDDGTTSMPDTPFGEGPADAYLVLGTASAHYGEIAEGYPEGWADELGAELVASGEWQVVFRSGDTQVLRRPAQVTAP